MTLARPYRDRPGYRRLVRCLLTALLTLPFGGRVQAQSGAGNPDVTATSQTICIGSSLTVHGNLFVWPYNVTALSVRTAGGETIDLDGTVSPQQTTDYILSYKKNGQDAILTATATVTVQHPPFIRLSGNVAAGEVCPGTEITYRVDSAAHVDEAVRWTLSTGEPTQAGSDFTFTPKQSCTLYIAAANSHCGSTEHKLEFRLIPPLTFDKPDVTLNPPVYSTCANCTFALPDWESWSIQPSEGQIDTAKTTLTWRDGTTDERTLNYGYNTLGCTLNLTLVQKNACESLDHPVQIAFGLTVHGLDCQPHPTYAITLSPCEWEPAYLYAHADSAHVISYAPATLDIQPAWDGLEIRDSTLYLPVSNGYALTKAWFLRAYDNPRTNPDAPEMTATYTADYTMACPYSQIQPKITESVQYQGTVVWDDKWLDTSYQYCDRTQAILDITTRQANLRIDTVLFDGFPADSLTLLNRTDNEFYFQSVHTVSTKIAPNFDRYEKLRLRVAISRTADGCRFADTIAQEVTLKEGYGCYPDFWSDYDACTFNGKACAGAEHRLYYYAPLYYQKLDSLKIARSGFILDPVFAREDAQHLSCTFRPYFATADREAAGRQFDTVVFFGFYHDTMTLEAFRDTFYFEIDLRSCAPVIRTDLNPDCTSGCMACPGSEWRTTVDFINPSTDTNKIRVRWLKPPKGRQLTDSLLCEPLDGYYDLRWLSRFTLYEPSDFSLEIVYNEGDSLRTLSPAPLPVSEFRIDPACAPRFELHRDSCCDGDHIYWHIYADFYNHFLERATWDNAPSDVRPGSDGWDGGDTGGSSGGTGSGDSGGQDEDDARSDYTYPSYPNPVRPRLTYSTDVRLPALYPYTVSYTVGDTLLTYRDTLRIAAIANPDIFTLDSLYICSGNDVDLSPYINRDVVAELIGINDPHDLLLKAVGADRVFPLRARMKYTCDHGDEISNDIHIFAEGDVQLSLDPTTAAVCPLDSLNLHLNRLSSNGRLHWLKKRWLGDDGSGGAGGTGAGGWEADFDTLFANVRYNHTLFDRVDADSVEYQVVAFTACPLPPQTGRFKAVRLPKPEIAFTDVHACYPDSLRPAVTLSGEPTVAGSGQWFLEDVAAEPPYAPTYDTLTLVFTALGTNGCWGRGKAPLYSYRPPLLQPAAPFCLHEGIEGVLELSGADIYVWEGFGRPDPADGTGARYLLQTARDTVVSATGTDLTTGCVSRDTFNIRLYAPRLTRTTDTLCWLDDWRQPFVGDSLTRIDWYFNGAATDGPDAADGLAEGAVGRDSLRRYPLQMADTGVYTRISQRAGCIDTQRYRLRLHPVPDRRLYGTDTLCEHESLQLFYAHNAQSVYGGRTGFAWFAPDGHAIASPRPADTIALRLDSVQPADSGWYAMRLSYGDCRLRDSLHVTVHPIPFPNLPADTFLCETRYLILDAFNPDYPNGLYTWPDELNPFPGNGGHGSNGGHGDGPDGDTAAASRPATAVRLEQGGVYPARLTVNGCTGTIAVRVEERPLPVFHLPADTLVCRGEECFFYLPDHYDAYAWWYADAPASPVGHAPQQGFTGSGLIQAEVIHNGCVDTAACLVERIFCGSLYFASAFTPNGNRINDHFGSISIALPEDLYYELTVFDRNGQPVFRSTDPTESWDGTFRGRDCPAGVYTYQCRASVRRNGRDLSSSGRIVLIR